MKLLQIIIPVILLVLSTATFNASAGTDATTILVIKANNDYFKRSKHPSSDKRYTHGTSIGIVKKGTFSFLNKVGKQIQKMLSCDDLYTSAILLQDIYTSDNIEDPIPAIDEHPYSGEMDVIIGLHFRKDDHKFWIFDQQSLYSSVVSLGATGKYSFAENSQKEIHRLTGDTIPEAWEYQLASHFAAKLSLSVKKKYSYTIVQDWGLSFQKTVHISGDIGNTLVQGAMGGEFRIGFHIPDDFGLYAQGAGNIGANIQGEESVIRSKGDRFGLYLIFLAEARYLRYDYHLGEYVTPVRGIGDLGLGAGFATSRMKIPLIHLSMPAIKIELCYIRRTEEFKEQDGPHRFGTFSIVAPLN
jgi:hypothetical protein